jgi:hypothetical protein
LPLLLHAMHREAEGKGTVLRLHEFHMARGLRRWLKVAGVRRPKLHKGSPTPGPPPADAGARGAPQRREDRPIAGPWRPAS